MKNVGNFLYENGRKPVQGSRTHQSARGTPGNAATRLHPALHSKFPDQDDNSSFLKSYLAEHGKPGDVLAPKIFGLGRGGYQPLFSKNNKDQPNGSKTQEFIDKATNSSTAGALESAFVAAWEILINAGFLWPITTFVSSVRDYKAKKQTGLNKLRLGAAAVGAATMLTVGALTLTGLGMSLATLMYIPFLGVLGTAAGFISLGLAGAGIGMYTVNLIKAIRNSYKHRNNEASIEDLEKVDIEQLKENGYVDPKALENLKAFIRSKLLHHVNMGVKNPFNKKYARYKALEEALKDGNTAHIGAFLQDKLRGKEIKYSNLEMVFLEKK